MKTIVPFFLLCTFCSAETALTIYNSNLGVIRDQIPVDLDVGTTSLTYDKATAQVIPDSVVLRDPSKKVDFTILEQSYRNDPVSQGLLLSINEGETIDFAKIYPDGQIRIIPGTIIRSGYGGGRNNQPVIEVDGKLQFSLPGQPRFPSLGDNSILKPTLGWKIDSVSSSNFDAQLSYISRGFTWKASYNVVAPEKGEEVGITGWVTINNNSGTSFANTKVKLVAGDVNIVPEYEELMIDDAFAPRRSGMRLEKRQVTEKAFDDFHLYTLPRNLNLKDKEQKQVEFLRAPKIKAKKAYIYDPSAGFRYRGGSPQVNPMPGQRFNQDVAIFWKFKNSKENGLAVPLPAGTVRFYRNDEADNNLEFVGENNIDHTATNEMVEIYTGNAFDLIGEKTVTNFKKEIKQDVMYESFKITLKNRSKENKTITYRDHAYRWTNWEISKSDLEFSKEDTNTLTVDVPLKPDEERVFTYTIKYSW